MQKPNGLVVYASDGSTVSRTILYLCMGCFLFQLAPQMACNLKVSGAEGEN
jgi:hypothetical protein